MNEYWHMLVTSFSALVLGLFLAVSSRTKISQVRKGGEPRPAETAEPDDGSELRLHENAVVVSAECLFLLCNPDGPFSRQ
ncbi:hypothetical protein J3E68DRAFT_415578 [Trichoderma sp. SZMC 28012]